MMPSVPGLWQPGPWSLEVESPLAVPEGPGSRGDHQARCLQQWLGLL